MYLLTVDCTKEFEKIVDLVKVVIFILKVATPIVLIITGGIDFAMATIAKDENDMEKAKKKFILRIVMACGVFLLFTIMELINNILIAVGVESEWLACWGLK